LVRYFFAIIICISCVIAVVACASRAEPTEVYYPVASEEEVPMFPFYFDGVLISEQDVLASETEFIAIINDFGLDWEISPRQAQNILRRRPDIQSLFIVCPEGLVGGLISLYETPRSLSKSPFIEVEPLLVLQIITYREPTEKELERLQQTGLLTDDEWNAFWDLSGILLDKKDDVAIIAERAGALMRDVGPHETHRFLEGQEGTVKYSFLLKPTPAAGLYWFTIELGVI